MTRQPGNERLCLTLGRPLPEAVLLLWAACAAFVVWQSLTPQPALPSFFLADKIAHLCAYFGLALLPWAGFRKEGAAFYASLSMLALGALLELCQMAVPERSGSFADMAANALGVALGLWVGRTLRARLRFPGA